MTDSSLFDKVVDESGLAGVLARGAIFRACKRAGIADPHSLSKRDLPKCLPELEGVLRLYLPTREINGRLFRLKKLQNSFEYVHNYNLQDPLLDE